MDLTGGRHNLSLLLIQINVESSFIRKVRSD